MKHTLLRPLIACMLLLVAFVGLAPALAAQDGEPKEEGPTEEEVAAQAEKLSKALEEGSYEDKLAALVASRAFPHDDIVKLVADATKDKAQEVRVCAVASLGYLDVDSALSELHKYTKKKSLLEDEQFALETYRAIGRHGKKKSLKILEDNILGSPKAVLECRILAIARVRDFDSVDIIVSLMNKLRSTDGGKGEPKGGREDVPDMPTIQLALHVLTGADEGTKRADWQRWWNDNKHDIEVTEEYPPLDRAHETKWREFWDEGGRGGRGDRGEGRREKDGGGEGEDDGGEVPPRSAA